MRGIQLALELALVCAAVGAAFCVIVIVYQRWPYVCPAGHEVFALAGLMMISLSIASLHSCDIIELLAGGKADAVMSTVELVGKALGVVGLVCVGLPVYRQLYCFLLRKWPRRRRAVRRA